MPQCEAGHRIVATKQFGHTEHTDIKGSQGISFTGKFTQLRQAVQVQLCQSIVEHFNMCQFGVCAQI